MDWDRQRDTEGNLEPNLWYGRFTLYRLMGSGRSLLGCVNQERVRRGTRKYNGVPGAWTKAFEKWEWRKRAEAWDEHCRQEDEAKWLRRREEIREREWDTASKLLEKAEQMLRFPISRAVVKGESTVIEPADWRFRDIGTIAETASKLARLAAQMETTRGSLDVTSKGEKIGSGLTADQRLALLSELAERVGSMAEGPDTGE